MKTLLCLVGGILVCAAPLGAATAAEPAKPSADVVASGDHDSGAVLEVMGLKRTSDGFLQVRFRYRNPTDKPLKAYHGQFAVTGDTDVTRNAFGEIYYVEPNQKLKHPVVSDNAGKLVCSTLVARDLLAPAKETGPTFWVKMGSPSDGVDKITFYFPNVTPIEDVPVPAAK